MPYSHQFVCLASSKKPYGRCIAGKLWGGENQGVWIRPVSNREHDSISDVERTYANGQTAAQREKSEEARLRRECQGRPNAGACLGYTR